MCISIDNLPYTSLLTRSISTPFYPGSVSTLFVHEVIGLMTVTCKIMSAPLAPRPALIYFASFFSHLSGPLSSTVFSFLAEAIHLFVQHSLKFAHV